MSSALLKKLLKKFKLNESTISLVLGTLVVIVVGGLVINYFRGKPIEQLPTVSVSPESIPPELPATYKVIAGDSLWKIAQNFYGSGYNWVDIAQVNSLSKPNFIAAGQELTIPKVEPRLAQVESITGDSYTVVKGDCLWKIAVRAYGDGYKWVKIARENNLANPDLIHPGNVLLISR